MTISLMLICLLFIRLFVSIHGAPKLGHLLFDPLEFETNVYSGNKQPIAPRPQSYLNLRNDDKSKEKKESKEDKFCPGYDFDETKCKNINNRIICGYNKNLGNLKDNEAIVDMGNGCRLRGDRIECGYVARPFTNPRRPPAQDKHESIRKLASKEEQMVFRTNLISTLNRQSSISVKPVLSTDRKLDMIATNVLKKVTTIVPNLNITNQIGRITSASTVVDKIVGKTNQLQSTKNVVDKNTQSTEATIEMNVTISNETDELKPSPSTTNVVGLTHAATIKPIRRRHITSCVEKGDRIVCYDF